MSGSTYLILVLVSALLFGCTEHTESEIASGNSDMQLFPPPQLINTRMIDQESLFAEVSISYPGVSTSVTAQREADTGSWTAQLQVPTQTEFTISVTWFDLLDPVRLDLVTSVKTLQPVKFPGHISIINNFFDFESDNFDADSDSIVNLTERLNGTSPFDPTSPPDGDTPDDGPPINIVVNGYEFVNNSNGAVNVITDSEDVIPVSVVQTVPVLDSTVPSSIDTPITLFFNDKLLFESLLGNIT